MNSFKEQFKGVGYVALIGILLFYFMANLESFTESEAVVKEPNKSLTNTEFVDSDQVEYYTPAPEDNTGVGYPTNTEQLEEPDNYEACPITTCNDSTCSQSTGRGTCSWHGGVAY